MKDFNIDGYTKIFTYGDGNGITCSLAQAAAYGLYIADKFYAMDTSSMILPGVLEGIQSHLRKACLSLDCYWA
jgi:hypothetical protein